MRGAGIGVFDGALSRPRFTTLLAGGFATLPLVIAAVGVDPLLSLRGD